VPSVSGTLALALATLTALVTVVPGTVVVLSLLWLVVARVADRTITGVMRRRYAYGPRPGDVGMAVAATPWRVLTALLPAALAALLPAALAVSAAFLAGSLISPAAPRPLARASLVAAAVTWWLAAWWGPGGTTLRRGTRGIARALAGRRRAHGAVLALLALVLLSALVMSRGGAVPDWGPLHPRA
jgi:hypothetical protein